MGMNTTLVGLIIVIIILIPVLYMIMAVSGKNKKKKKEFELLAQNKGIHIKNSELITSLLIGLDSGSKKLVFSNKDNLNREFQIIDLKEVTSCSARSSGLDSSLNWVGLEIKTGKNTLKIPFYRDEDESAHGSEPLAVLQQAKEWEKRISALLV